MHVALLHSKGRLLAFPANVRVGSGYKWLTVNNTLAYSVALYKFKKFLFSINTSVVSYSLVKYFISIFLAFFKPQGTDSNP
jgi:hypothetical protein